MIATDSELLRKYDVPGPRYTSYPTILHWDRSPSAGEWIQTLQQSLNESESRGTGAAMYVHIPFCRSLCTYCGCNSRITANTCAGASYVRTVLNEWQLYLDQLKRTRPIPLTELHLGGGTPTYLSAAELKLLISGILESVEMTPEAEFSVESDPRVTQPEHLQTLFQLGFKRLSLGVQDFDSRVQEAVNRVQTEEQVRVVTETARTLGYTSINYDLIYGLPFQTIDSVSQTVQAVMRLRPDRIAFYGYAHVPWVKPGQRHFTEADLPSGDEKRALYEFGRALLEDAGYREIGMDHFALESDSLWEATLNGQLHRNFMGYTARLVAPLIGLGVSSISDSWNAFVQNEKQLEDYEARVNNKELPITRGHILSNEDKILRRHVLNLMTQGQTDWQEPALFTPFLTGLPARLGELERDGLVKLSNQRCEITAAGKPFMRNICMAFDAHLAQTPTGTRLFSRTI